MLERTSGRPLRHPVLVVAVAALLALTLAPGLEAQQDGGNRAEASSETTLPTVRPAVFARIGPGIDFDADATMIGTAGGGADIAFSRRFGLRLEGEVLMSLAEGNVAFAAVPAAVLYLGDGAPAGPSLRAGPLIWTGIGAELTSAQVLGPFAALSLPIGDAGLRFESSAALLSTYGVLLDVGIGWTLP